MPARVAVVPGLAVRGYAVDAVRALRAAGHDASLLRPPAWRGAPADLRRYGEALAASIDARRVDVDLLVGLSVGTQAAALAAAGTPRVRRLLLVSPTVDPANRGVLRLAATWLDGGDPQDDAPSWRENLPDWARAGLPRIVVGYLSALRLPLERVLPRVPAELTIVHAEHDSLGGRDWAAALAEENGGRLVDLPGAVHSWPVDDSRGFVRLVDEVLA
jgi:hypothetical protein